MLIRINPHPIHKKKLNYKSKELDPIQKKKEQTKFKNINKN